MADMEPGYVYASVKKEKDLLERTERLNETNTSHWFRPKSPRYKHKEDECPPKPKAHTIPFTWTRDESSEEQFLKDQALKLLIPESPSEKKSPPTQGRGRGSLLAFLPAAREQEEAVLTTQDPFKATLELHDGHPFGHGHGHGQQHVPPSTPGNHGTRGTQHGSHTPGHPLMNNNHGSPHHHRSHHRKKQHIRLRAVFPERATEEEVQWHTRVEGIPDFVWEGTAQPLTELEAGRGPH